MKSQLNEIQKLQKIAGILKENINEAPLTINQVVKQLNKIANSKGFYAVDKSADEKPRKGASGVNNLVKWEDADDNVVELYYNNPDAPLKVTVNDLEINFDGPNSSGNDSVAEWLDPARWDEAFEEESTPYDDEDYSQDQELEDDIEDLNMRINELRDELEETDDKEEERAIRKELTQLNKEYDKLVAKQEKLSKK
tara:strand:+ start:1020 stop:1607 length:588 start_codon:yes stop_codon:yes gene_type:complete